MTQIGRRKMKEKFVQPRFTGARFKETTLPVELARDLVAYQDLIIDLAKHLFHETHPERKRVPINFASAFQLHIDKIEPGSARPVLALLAASCLNFGGSGDDYFTKARDLVAECIRSETVPPEFPLHLLSYFRSFGASLKPDESIEFTVGDETAVLTPQKRERLVEQARHENRLNIVLSGVLEAVNWHDSTFTLRQLDGKPVTIPLPEDFRNQVGKYGDRPRFLIKLEATGIFDSHNKLVKVESPQNLDVLPDYMIADRFNELSKLEDGWFDGDGKAPDKSKLSFVARQMVSKFPEELPIPAIVPKPDGNLLLEWQTTNTPSVDIDLSTMRADFHAFTEDDDDLEKEFDLSIGPNWVGFYEFLLKNVTEKK